MMTSADDSLTIGVVGSREDRPMEPNNDSDLRGLVVGDTGIEPVTSSV
jgi:hypothetical protein